MKILLDIDGVMLPANSWERPAILSDGFMEFNKTSVDCLNRILHSSLHSKIVLTSSHRTKYSINEWLNIFNLRGVDVKRIDKVNDFDIDKKTSILSWIEFNKKETYIIIDDDSSLNGLPQEIKNNFVFTKSSIGLCKQDLENSIHLFESLSFFCDNKRHLVCKPYSKRNLDRMADELSIKRCWFHKDHYDIPLKRIEEIKSKCEIVSSKEIIKIIGGRIKQI